MRVLLVHADPFQRLLPATPHAFAELRAELAGLAETRVANPFFLEDWRGTIERAVTGFRPELVGLGVRAGEEFIGLLPEVRELRDRIATLAPDVPIVWGGSTSPDFASAVVEQVELSRVPARGFAWASIAGLVGTAVTSFGGAVLSWP